MSRDHVQSAQRPTGGGEAPTDGVTAVPATALTPPEGAAEAPFLELLARGASVDAYEQPVLLARAEGQPS
ncbi:hypothetical protein AB0K93_33815, partial [Streptomyces sp. NPDC052676]|uniref:hypothetical protein n=1 Tax=Streptomyces sp. NPDC052676 TaxID=3154953 RepID=UPI0034184306